MHGNYITTTTARVPHPFPEPNTRLGMVVVVVVVVGVCPPHSDGTLHRLLNPNMQEIRLLERQPGWSRRGSRVTTRMLMPRVQ
jgi:hypothetical protein